MPFFHPSILPFINPTHLNVGMAKPRGKAGCSKAPASQGGNGQDAPTQGNVDEEEALQTRARAFKGKKTKKKQPDLSATSDSDNSNSLSSSFSNDPLAKGKSGGLRGKAKNGKKEVPKTDALLAPKPRLGLRAKGSKSSKDKKRRKRRSWEDGTSTNSSSSSSEDRRRRRKRWRRSPSSSFSSSSTSGDNLEWEDYERHSLFRKVKAHVRKAAGHPRWQRSLGLRWTAEATSSLSGRRRADRPQDTLNGCQLGQDQEHVTPLTDCEWLSGIDTNISRPKILLKLLGILRQKMARGMAKTIVVAVERWQKMPGAKKSGGGQQSFSGRGRGNGPKGKQERRSYLNMRAAAPPNVAPAQMASFQGYS
jgi:hypothetical protein